MSRRRQLYARFLQVPWPLSLAFVLGIAVRFIWAMTRHAPLFSGEAMLVATAMAEGRGFADAFYAGQGPTAHLMPVAPVLTAGLLLLFGVNTIAVSVAMILWSLSLSFCAFALSTLAFRLIGVSRIAGASAFCLLCLSPVYATEEAVQWATWEGGLGLCVALAGLVLILQAERTEQFARHAVARSVLPAIAFFVHPVMGLTALSALAFFSWRHRGGFSLGKPVLLTAFTLTALIAPWTLRNALVMGHPIALRDNLGLELAVGNYAGAETASDHSARFQQRLAEVQPYNHPAVQRRMNAAGGEFAWSAQLGRDTEAWMRAHPSQVLVIWARHGQDMLFTRPWQFEIIRGGFARARSAIVQWLAFLALIALALAARRREPLYTYAAVFIIVPVFCYILFQPIARYAWLIYPTLTCLAADAVTRAGGYAWRNWLPRLRRSAGSPAAV